MKRRDLIKKSALITSVVATPVSVNAIQTNGYVYWERYKGLFQGRCVEPDHKMFNVLMSWMCNSPYDEPTQIMGHWDLDRHKIKRLHEFKDFMLWTCAYNNYMGGHGALTRDLWVVLKNNDVWIKFQELILESYTDGEYAESLDRIAYAMDMEFQDNVGI